MSTPVDGQRVARNVRFRVGERTDCGEALPSVRPEYRIVGPQGSVAFDRVPSAWDHGELVPRDGLLVGAVTLEARDPIAEHEWGPWHALETVWVDDRIDDAAPEFDGIAAASAAVVTGTIFLSPCEAMDGPVVETVIELVLADDGPTPHDELIYLLDRRANAEAPWQTFRSFRPSPTTTGHGRVSWQDEDGFDERWSYRLRVVDASGHETIGAMTATVSAPLRPQITVAGELAATQPQGSETENPPAKPMMEPAWQWFAALGTLLGAGLVGLGRRRRSQGPI